jgi:integrase
MSVYSIKYKVLNRDTGRKVTVIRWRVQIRLNGNNVNKLFAEEILAREFEKKQISRIKCGLPYDKTTDLDYLAEMPDMRKMLSDYFHQYMSKQAQSALRTNQNRCLSAIPSISILAANIGSKLSNYRYGNWLENSRLKPEHVATIIPFADFKIDTVDFWLLILYMDSRREKGIKDNTILREISTISSAFEKVYKLYPDKFPNGLANPVKMLPRGEKPKQNLDRKRILSAEESTKIAGWLKLKVNQEPYFLFVMCLESGARKSEVLGMQWENIDFENWSIYLPKTKNGKPRSILIPDAADLRTWLLDSRIAKGKVFKLTTWNFRYYWVRALKVLEMYDEATSRLHFHDTRRTAVTKLIRQKQSNVFQIAKAMGLSPQSVEREKQNMPERMSDIFAKLRRGEALLEQEIMLLVGHGSMAMTNTYYGDRN